MGKIFQRSFAGFFALLFLVTSSALTIVVIITLIDSSSSNSSSNSSNSSQTSSSTKKLAGSQLSGFTPVPSVPSLQTTDLKMGSGATVQAGQTVSVDYTGALASTGVIFQSSLDNGQPVSLTLAGGQVITGWVQGLPGMKVGGTRRLLIPAPLAYGANPPQGSGIPANANLVFDVTVHSIQK